MFINDPFIKISEIMKQLRKIDEAIHKKDDIEMKKALNKYSDGNLFKESA